MLDFSVLNSTVKISNDSELNQEWIRYRDEQSEMADSFNVSWVYAIFLLLLTFYSAVLVFLPAPDHKVFVQVDNLPEAQSETENSSSSTFSTNLFQKFLDKDGYMPLTRFLGKNK
ncbi:hypothetical protein M3Y97_00518300 [Aphelenchoides bicaudatus]|nr:hypothetical protein M3Y97_00518300 [Aphelenchoides bicaudatus]